MKCQACGRERIGGAAFCQECGARLEGERTTGAGRAPWMPMASPAGFGGAYLVQVKPRVDRHQQSLGILWCVFGGYRLLHVFIASVALHAMAENGLFEQAPYVSHLMRAFGPAIAVTAICSAVLAFVAGYGLLTRRPWARIVAMVAGVLSLLKIPFGTALGIYTLWVLAPAASSDEWDRISVGVK